MRIAITGATGQLGRALQARLADQTLLPLARPTVDISDLDAVLTAIEGFAPDVVIHAAAHTNVDDCERQPELAFRINALGARNLAVAAARAARHPFSTNCVADGQARGPTTRAPVNQSSTAPPVGQRGRREPAAAALRRPHRLAV
jgi:dTDP-4-dehydrorhamnose reductase